MSKNMYTIELKKEVIGYAKKRSIPEAVYKYRIGYSTIQQWVKNKQKIEKLSSESEIKNVCKVPKTEVLEYAKLKSVAGAAKKFKVPAATIRIWLNEPVIEPVADTAVDVDIKQQLKTLLETVIYKAIDAL